MLTANISTISGPPPLHRIVIIPGRVCACVCVCAYASNRYANFVGHHLRINGDEEHGRGHH